MRDYGCAVWDPFTNKDINTLEAVQNKAARFVKQDYSRDSSVSQMKEQLEWRPLQADSWHDRKPSTRQ